VPWSRRRGDVATLGIVAVIQAGATLQVLTSLPQWHGLSPDTTWLAWGPDREVMRPVMVAIILAGALTAAGGIAVAVQRSTATIDTLYTLENVALAGVPLTFLIAAARRWLARERVPELIRQLGFSPTPATAQDALRQVLNDPEAD